MTKKSHKILSAIIAALFFTQGTFVFAQTDNQSSNLEKAFENVKEQVNDLVAAKDENKPNELAVRIETFKKVIDFSITEAKDLKVKLLSLDFDDEKFAVWQKKMVESLNQTIKYYETEKQNLEENEKEIDFEEIKTIAQNFKDWRDANYLTAADQINEFLLTQQEKQAIQTAKKRSQKIAEDIQKLQKAKIKGLSGLNKFLNRADLLIKEGDQINKEAEKIFEERYLAPLEKTNSTSSAAASSSADSNLKIAAGDRSLASTTKDTASAEEPQLMSIKDLVKDSLIKIKEAYQIFIEMSNFVRKLLK